MPEQQFYSLKDAAEVLKVQPYRIVYLLTTGQVPEPRRIGGKRIFTIMDLHRLAKQLDIENIRHDLIGKRGREMDEDNPVIQAAKEYAANTAVYKSMTEIGKVLGVSLARRGEDAQKDRPCETPEGKPTQAARDGGFVRTVRMLETFFLDIWHEEQTLNVLRPLIEESQK